MRLKPLAAILVLSLSSLGAEAATKSKAPVNNLIRDFEIVKADKLSFQDNNSTLEGHTQVKVGEYLISADKVDMITPPNAADPSQINFVGSVFLESKDIDIKSTRMDYDTKLKQLKCYADGVQVVSTVKTVQEAKSSGPATISSDYQEFDFIANKGRAEGAVKYDSSERDITSDEAYIYFASDEANTSKELSSVNFLNQVVLLEKDKRVESNDLQYLPHQKLVRIASNAKILYFTDEQKPIFLFADLVVLETDRQVFSAYSTSRDSHSRLYTDDAYAESRQIVMNQTLDGKPDQAVLTGMAYSQMGDKAVVGEEILFNIAAGTMKTLVNRPQTLIFSAKAQ